MSSPAGAPSLCVPTSPRSHPAARSKSPNIVQTCRGEPCVERGILSRHLGAHADAALVNVDFGAAHTCVERGILSRHLGAHADAALVNFDLISVLPTLARDVREIACCV
jgi:hypothetical protein